jgi:hypothetical protein
VIATSGPGAGGDIAWRISIATVRNGAAFSLFPEYARLFLPLVAGSIRLATAKGGLRSHADGSIRFPGAEAVTARVPGGAAYALNVMTMPGRATPHLTRRPVPGHYANTDPRVRASILVGGSVSTPDGRRVDAPAVVPAGVPVVGTGAEIVEVSVDESATEPAGRSGEDAGATA